MGACKLYNVALHLYCVKCTLYKVCGYRLTFTATRSKNRTTITNMIFLPRGITSLPEWIGTRQPAGRSTAKIHYLEQVRLYFWGAELCQELINSSTTYLQAYWLSSAGSELLYLPSRRYSFRLVFENFRSSKPTHYGRCVGGCHVLSQARRIFVWASAESWISHCDRGSVCFLFDKASHAFFGMRSFNT